MKPNANDRDPAFSAMTVDILGNVLSRADNPGDVGEYVCEEIRELTGARCVLLIQCLGAATVTGHRVVSVNPVRRREWAGSPATERLYEAVHSLPAARLIRAEEPTEIAVYLRQEGFELSMVIPLCLGDLRIGAILVLGLPDEEHISSVLGMLDNLSTIVALVLRNSFLFESQEEIIRERTSELRNELAERKKAEEALRRAHEELEMRVIERTSELKKANEHLELEIAERKRAEADLSLRSQELARSNADLEQFAYVASHDLQEPLRMVASYLQLLEKRYWDKLDSDANDFIGFAVDGARRMQVLIADLLAYSRIGTRGQSFRPVNCEQALEKAMINLHIAIQESGAQITHTPLTTVWGDAMQLTQLFQNLIGNAIKFRRDRPPEIYIRAEPEEDAWRFSVRDNGIGIEPQHFERIFMVFQRLHSRSAYPGTGIGLAICKKIVERHGGAIWVESEPGQGATFYFTIPKKGGTL
jgi:signal transduction histidine kinase